VLRGQQSRGMIFLVLLMLAMVGALGRCWYLQYYKCDYYRQRAARQQYKVIPQSPRRGLITDCKGRVLAISVPKPSVWLDPYLVEDKVQMAKDLARILDLDGDELFEQMEAGAERRFMRVKRWVSQKEAEELKELKAKGLIVADEYQRQYPMGALASHVIGFTDIDGVGLEGIEKQYNKYLSGKAGELKLRSDIKRRPIRAEEEAEPVEDGQTVVLSLDAVIQRSVEEELSKTVRKFGAASGTAIVMDPRTGWVLALANWPNYAPANARSSDASRRRNQALTDPYEPGSTFKPFTAAAALEGGFVTLGQQIDCLEGPYSGKGFGTIQEYKNYFGVQSVADILIRSSNIGAAKLAQKMGSDYFYRMIEKFGFGRKTGIDLPGESEGIPGEKVGKNGEKITLSSQLKERYGPGYTLTRVGYGQSIAITPIQLLRGFCCFANGGRLVKPQVAKGIVSEGEVTEDFCKFSVPGLGEAVAADEHGGCVIKTEIARRLVDEAMAGVVAREGGTAHQAHLEKWQVFGKTGTANVPRKDRPGYEEHKWISSFVAGAPVKEPRVCVLVVIREPNRSLGFGYTGGAVAAPAVKEILEETLAYLSVDSDQLPVTSEQ